MSETVTLDVTTLEETVSVTTTDGGTVEISVVAQRGATGPAGPNTVTSATTSDGTALLDVSRLTAETIEIEVGANVTTLSTLMSTSRDIAFPDANGTVALTSDIVNAITSATSSNGTGIITFASVGSPIVKASTSAGVSARTNSGTECFSWGAGNGQNFTFTAGTGVAFNATTYTFGTGAAAALNTALGTTRVMRTTLATRTSGTMTADDTLVLPVLSGVTYRVRVHSLTKNSTATVGMVLRIDHPGITASGSDSVGHLMNGGGNAAITPSSSTSLTNSVNQNGQNLSTISEVILTPTANGNVSVVWAARVPAGVETAGLNIGSYLEVIRLS